MAMNFNVETQASTFDVNKAYNTMYNDRVSTRDENRTTAPSRGFFGDDVIGLDATKIPQMKAAITDMCKAIGEKLGEMETDIDSFNAYKGEGIDTELKNYLGKVAAYCNNLTSTLRAFNDKLTDVETQWKNATTSMGQQIGNTGGSFATGSQYTENLQ